MNKLKISEFAKKVYEVTKKIPKGRVSTYGLVARAIRKPKASRAVGQALKVNPFAPVVPCHRVVKSNGAIGGFNGKNPKNIKRKILILTKEGIKVKSCRIENFSKIVYNFK